jgi:mono/diheme cytochrome c family protein
MNTPHRLLSHKGYLALAVIIVVLIVAFLWIVVAPGPMHFASGRGVRLADYRGPDPTGVPATIAQASLIQRGAYLAHAADCEACHTAPGGAPFAGGLAFVLPFGVLYSTNITPDSDTGIGRYTDENFLQALRHGVRADGTRLYPAMPYPSYTYMTDADALAIKAYLFSLDPTKARAPSNDLVFPFNQRWLMGIWSLLFNPDRRFEANPAQSPEWNRGAYLVEAMAHCGECHTPRNLFQALDNRRKFAGATQAGWRAYNITADARSGVGAFSDTDLSAYLATGHADGHGTAAGPMGEAVDKSLSQLASSDIAAMVVYLRSVPPIETSDLAAPKETPAAISHREGAPSGDLLGKAVFAEACVSCHSWSGVSPLMRFATLTGTRAVNDPTAINVAQIVLSGAQRRSATGLVVMPAFGAAYSDAEIAAVSNYTTARFGAQASMIAASEIAKLRTER